VKGAMGWEGKKGVTTYGIGRRSFRPGGYSKGGSPRSGGEGRKLRKIQKGGQQSPLVYGKVGKFGGKNTKTNYWLNVSLGRKLSGGGDNGKKGGSVVGGKKKKNNKLNLPW